MQNILEGLTIIEGSAFIAAPSGGMTVAQLGADVIRFDQIGGGIDYRRWPVDRKGNSLYWHSLNKGKRSIAVDLKSDEGRELIVDLITVAGENRGIFVSNFPARGWLADKKLRDRREDLIYVSLAGDRHGSSALDYTVNSKVGIPFLNGDGKTPLNSALPAWDIIAGQQIAVGLLAAERHRRLTGEGQFVSLTLADIALATMGHLGYLAEAQVGGVARQPMGNSIFGTFGHDFECSDGGRVMIVGVSLSQWNALVKMTGVKNEISALEIELEIDCCQEGDRFIARHQLIGIIAPWFKARSTAKAHQELVTAGVCWGPYQTLSELVSKDVDCSVQNPLFSLIEQPGIGELLTPSQPLKFHALPSEEPSPAPALGQNTEEILIQVLGLSDQQIGRLLEKRIVAVAD
ncbi:CoA transferase [bacterium]|nr:CoA transferase [bacterium]MDB2443651.1 CoA transferase [Gammaproteobacteria bacterium]